MKKRNLALAFGGAIGAAVAVKMLTRAKSVDWNDVSDLVPHAENSHFAQVDGARVHYQEFGEASNPTLLLIHGYTASLYVWKTVAPMLADEGFHVVALDLLGFGYSEKPSWFDYSITSQARMLARFMNRIGIGRATLVGSSYGGAVAATLALDYPERVEKLILIDTVCNDALKNHPVLKLASIPVVGEALAPFLIDSRAYQRRRMRGTLAPANHDLITDERVEGILRPLTAADAHHSLLATSRNWHAERIEQVALRHAEVRIGMIRRHRSLVAPPEVDRVPRERIASARGQHVEHRLRRRAARQRDSRDAACSDRMANARGEFVGCSVGERCPVGHHMNVRARRHPFGFSTWPPNWKRIAERSLPW